MESLRYLSPLLIPILSLLVLNSVSASLSHPFLAPKISPAASPSPDPQPQLNEVSFPPISHPPTESQPISDPPTESQSMPPTESQSAPLTESKSMFHRSFNTHPLLKKICDSTDYPSLCIATIAPHLKGKCDIMSVLGVAIHASIDATKLGILLANRMSTMPGTPPDVASILKNCKDSYEDALDNFKEAAAALPARDIGRLNSMLSAVITDVTDCEDEFAGALSPLTNYADKIANMTSNCLAIVSLIPDHQ